MMLEVHTMAKMSVQYVAEREVTFECLDQIGLYAAAQPVEQVTEGSHEVINDKEECERPGRRGYADKLDFIGTGIFELHGEDSKVVLRREGAKHRQMTTAGGIIARYFVIVNSDVQGRASSSEILHLPTV